MPRFAAAHVAIAAVTLVACSDASPPLELVGQTRIPIAYGSLDSIHTAVVAVLAPHHGTTNQFEECSGSVVQVKGSDGYVLTAAHCCSQGDVPSVVVASSDYTVGEQYIFGGTPVPPTYAVVGGSVYYDAQFNINNLGAGYDFCMLKFSGATGSTPTLALPASSGDGLALGSTAEHIGYGYTETSTTNSARRTGSDSVDQALTSLLLEYSQGGPSHVPGTCAGDSGGPALFPAGAAQSQQAVVAVTSFGNDQTCVNITLGGASRVTAGLGTGGFITSYLADTPTGTQAVVTSSSVPAGGPWSLVATGAGLLAAGVPLRRQKRART